MNNLHTTICISFNSFSYISNECVCVWQAHPQNSKWEIREEKVLERSRRENEKRAERTTGKTWAIYTFVFCAHLKCYLLDSLFLHFWPPLCFKFISSFVSISLFLLLFCTAYVFRRKNISHKMQKPYVTGFYQRIDTVLHTTHFSSKKKLNDKIKHTVWQTIIHVNWMKNTKM